MITEDTTISKALETYLESVYILSRKRNYVRITDISTYLRLSKPSVNRAINILKVYGYVNHEPYGDISLTETGEEIAQRVYNRHHLIKKFLTNVLKISQDDADKEATSMEHSVSDSTIVKMAQYMEKAL